MVTSALENGREERIVPTGERKKAVTTLVVGRLLSTNPTLLRFTPILFYAKCGIWLEAELSEMQIINFLPAVWPSIMDHFKINFVLVRVSSSSSSSSLIKLTLPWITWEKETSTEGLPRSQ